MNRKTGARPKGKVSARRLSAAALMVMLSWLGPKAHAQDWPTFGWDVSRSSAPAGKTGLTPGAIGTLARQQVTIDGTVDGSAIYLRGVTIGGGRHDALFVTTTYGRTIALDADTGTRLWEFTPASYESLKGTYRITNATPVADADRQFIYAAAPDGVIRKLAVSDGHVAWATPITRLPQREKIASPLSFFRGRIFAATDGYIGDRPPYQGHVAILEAGTGALLHVWNSLCSDRQGLLDPASCARSDSGIWGRAGVVIDPESGTLYAATGNGLWDGKTNWGDSMVELDPDATRILGNYTPANTEQLDDDDADLGSTSPVLLGSGLVAQGGKDGLIRVLDWSAMRGSAPHRGGETATVPTPSANMLFTAPAVLHAADGTWLFAADNGGTSAWKLTGTTLRRAWSVGRGGTSPVASDGMLFVYDPHGGLCVYAAPTGRLIADLPCGPGHWNSPIVADGRIVLPEGNANHHQASGVLDIWRAR